LPAGQTPVPAYAALRRMQQSRLVDFSRATCFLVDEFVGLERSDSASFYQFVDEQLLSGINVDRTRVHSLDGAARDVAEECDRYEAAIATAGGIDLQILGV